jgi:hypothetical protein
MATNDADDLALFREVSVIRSTPPALICQIGEKPIRHHAK